MLAYYFALLSVGLSYGLYAISEGLRLHLPFWVALPTPMAIYLFIRWLFSQYIWRWPPLHNLGIVKILNLNGTYEGRLWSSHDESAKHLCALVISQTWTGISIRGTFPHSTSYNMVTGISVEGTAAPRLTYEYWNEPASNAPETMNAHRGTIWVDIILDDEVAALKGDYYTGRGRTTIGQIEVWRVRRQEN